MRASPWLINATLVLVAVIWGFGFVPQKLGMDYLSPAAFNAWRFALGALVVLPLIWLRKPSKKTVAEGTLKLGAGLGLLLFFGALLQQIALLYTSVANVAFITGLYVIVVPMIGYFLGYRYALIVWGGGVIAVVGLYLMTGGGSEVQLKGDMIALAGAVMWAAHLLLLAQKAGKHRQTVLAAYQFAFCAMFSVFAALIMKESLLPSDIEGYLWPLLNGVVVVGIGYTLQVVVMNKAEPFSAAVILSLEAVFGAIAGYWFFQEVLSQNAWIGAGLMLIGCVLAQRDSGHKKQESSP